MKISTTYKSPLHEMVSTTQTDFWNDSCAVNELTYAIEHGAVGATSNPTIVLAALQQEMDLWTDDIQDIIAANPAASEGDITWKVVEAVAIEASKLLLPVFDKTKGMKGRLSIQTNPVNYRDTAAIVEQTLHFNSLAPNLQVKIPATAAGIQAIEEVTYHGVNINATVCFSVSQAIAVADAVERGLERRKADNKTTEAMTPVCTIMVGRVDDWVNVILNRDNLTVHPHTPLWSGVAVMKNAYHIFQERQYQTRLLAAAYRHHLHWSEFIGGDMVLTIPSKWQKRFNNSDVPVQNRISEPVDPSIIQDMCTHIPDFRVMYEEDGLSIADFDEFGATVRTLRGFIASYHDLKALIREKFLLPNPDIG